VDEGGEAGRMEGSWEEYDFQDSRFKHSKNSMQSMNSKEVSPIAAVTHSKLSGNHKEVIKHEVYLRF
jgi:hypothetical protein